jgi:Amt family ammonium transporter
VTLHASVAIGITAGVVCYFAITFKNKPRLGRRPRCLGRARRGRHPGHHPARCIIGSSLVNPAAANGLLHGGGSFFVKQLVAVLVSSVYAFGFTYGMLWLINKFTPVRTSESEEGLLDESLHGETAYETNTL